MVNSGNFNSLSIDTEISGTKIQVGIDSANGKLLQLPVKRKVIRGQGADGIRRKLVEMATEALDLAKLHSSNMERVGIGFGGVLDSKRGIIIKSYQIAGWNNFPLRQ